MSIRSVRLALLPIAVAAAVAVEWASYDGSIGLALTGADLAAGCVLLAAGVVAWEHRPESRVGPLMALAGSTWFLGNLAAPLLYLHRGPLVQLDLSYPDGRLRSRLVVAVVGLAYLVAAIEPLARSAAVTLALSATLVATSAYCFVRANGSARRAAAPGLTAASAFAGVLALGAVERLAGWGADRTVLWLYDLVVAATALLLLVDLLRGRWTESVVAGLVVDLGAPAEGGMLRTKLARALGDPSLVVGYRLTDGGGYVDDAGRPVALPAEGSGRATTPLVEGGEQVAVLVHDEALLADRWLLESAAAAARVALSNVTLQAEARANAAELEASRRRIVEAADAQRRRLQRELQLGVGQGLERVGSLLAEARPALGGSAAVALSSLELALDEACRELEQFAHGVHPAALAEGGLMPALGQLAGRSPLPVVVRGSVGRLPDPVEAALFFVCSEGLANVVKHAHASRATIAVRADAERVEVEIDDDGAGGAVFGRGSGLVGLADRLEALGGFLRLDSPRGGGTRVVARLPR
jgi:signal transduction histidine kinase